MQLVVADDLRRWRLTVIFRWVLVIPHLAVAIAWASLVAIVWPVLWVLALVRGQAPAGLHAWMARFVRYYTQVCAYAYLVADPFPGFRGWPGRYPIEVEIAPPVRQRRWSIALRPGSS